MSYFFTVLSWAVIIELERREFLATMGTSMIIATHMIQDFSARAQA